MQTERIASINRFEGKRAILTLDDGQTLAVDRADITPSTEVGDQLSVMIRPVADAQLAKEDLARTLLNEILKS